MKATISMGGLLTIEGESEVEAYALRWWAAENMADGDETNLLIISAPDGMRLNEEMQALSKLKEAMHE